MVATHNKPKPEFNMFYGIQEPKLKIMRKFGEMAVVENHDRRKIRSKLENRGKQCVFLGVAPNHAQDVFRFLNLDTKHIIVSRTQYGGIKLMEIGRTSHLPKLIM
jgi:hypothetical protein